MDSDDENLDEHSFFRGVLSKKEDQIDQEEDEVENSSDSESRFRPLVLDYSDDDE